MKIQTMMWITILHTKDENKTGKQRTKINKAQECGEPNHITKLQLEFAKCIIFLQFPNNFALFTNISYIYYIYSVNQIRDISILKSPNFASITALTVPDSSFDVRCSRIPISAFVTGAPIVVRKNSQFSTASHLHSPTYGSRHPSLHHTMIRD